MMIGNLRGRARAWRSWLFALGLASVAFLFWLIIGGGSGSIAVAADGAVPTGADRYLTTSQLEAALDASPWPPRLHDEVTRLAICESGLWGLSTVWLDTRAERITAREHSLGVLQLNVRARPWLDALDLFDVRQNLIAGYTIWLERRGFDDWSCGT